MGRLRHRLRGLRTSGASGGDEFTVVFAGTELAHLMAGADFRLTRVFGIGPYADFAVGQYSRVGVRASKVCMSEIAAA